MLASIPKSKYMEVNKELDSITSHIGWGKYVSESFKNIPLVYKDVLCSYLFIKEKFHEIGKLYCLQLY